MSVRRKIPPAKTPARQALDDIGGEPLEGSGFEEEPPEPEFTEPEPAPESR